MTEEISHKISANAFSLSLRQETLPLAQLILTRGRLERAEMKVIGKRSSKTNGKSECGFITSLVRECLQCSTIAAAANTQIFKFLLRQPSLSATLQETESSSGSRQMMESG